jgi:hypothetical protein
VKYDKNLEALHAVIAAECDARRERGQRINSEFGKGSPQGAERPENSRHQALARLSFISAGCSINSS